MNFNNFTIKSQEVVQKAIELTRQSGQQQIEPVHILKALISESETIVNFVFQKLEANLNRQGDPGIAKSVGRRGFSQP